MKKEKIYFSTIVILIVAILLLLCAITLIINDKKDNSLDNYKPLSCEEMDIVIECSKDHEEVENYKAIQKYIVNVSSEGEVINYTNEYIYIYKNNDAYNKLKSSYFGEDMGEILFDDSKLQLTRSYKTTEMTDDEGNIISIWYKSYIKSLENSGYTCKEK